MGARRVDGSEATRGGECGVTFAVDIPNADGEEWGCLGYFETRDEAITFAQQRFGADEEGRVSLVSERRVGL